MSFRTYFTLSPFFCSGLRYIFLSAQELSQILWDTLLYFYSRNLHIYSPDIYFSTFQESKDIHALGLHSWCRQPDNNHVVHISGHYQPILHHSSPTKFRAIIKTHLDLRIVAATAVNYTELSRKYVNG